MSKPAKPAPTESSLIFESDLEPLAETLTALGGVPLVGQAFRSLGLPALVREHVRIKERQRGCDGAPAPWDACVSHRVAASILPAQRRYRSISQRCFHINPEN